MAEPDDDRIVQMISYVPESMRTQVRIEAATEDITMSQIVLNALKIYFKMPRGAAPKRRRRKS